ncbi:MAG: DUF4290 domain-containing protein [Bacteroidia bacterium]|jgi:hypothetical protein|nr:DUF4290 domain-containing protein [Bacteroidia bacterium]
MTELIDVEYNTQREQMMISEYGRNIQKMVNFAIAEPNRERRTVLANALIALMGSLNPQLRDVADYKHKLWDHLFIISDFKLDVDCPYPLPTRESVFRKPDLMDYPQSKIKFRFYGKNIVKMIEAATALEDGAMKTTFINLIGSFMKNACKSWNAETLSDEEILAHLEMLSEGKIRAEDNENVEFRTANFGNNPNNQNRNNNNNRNFKNKNRHRNGGNNNNNGGGNRNNNNRNFRNNKGR